MENKEMKMLKQPEIRVCVFFFHSILLWSDISQARFSISSFQAFLTRRIHQNIDLKAAYQIALAPQGWEAELEATQMAINKEQQDSEIDELESVDDENDASVKPTENRKRPSENETPASPNKKCKSVAAQPVDATAPATSAPAPLMAAAPAVQNVNLFPSSGDCCANRIADPHVRLLSFCDLLVRVGRRKRDR
jgi:hypothetical protein